jgi:hypothetical protein
MIIRNPLLTSARCPKSTVCGAHRREGLDLGLLRKVGELVLHVVHSHASIRPFESLIGFLRNPFERAIPSSEINWRRPVVGEVIRRLAGRASREFCRIHLFWTHVWHKRVATYDLV